MNNREKWIQAFRRILIDAGINDADLSDGDVLECMKAFMAPSICEVMNIKHQWQYEMYWQAMLAYQAPDPGLLEGIDPALLRAKFNQN